jgi:hypothetical protein
MIYMTEQPVPTQVLQKLIGDRYSHHHPMKAEEDVTTFYVPPHPTEAFLLLYRQNLYTTNQAMECEIGRTTTSRETPHNWHAYELSFWTGFVLINGSALLAAYPLKEGVTPRQRVLLTRSSTSVPLVSIRTNAYYFRFQQYEWAELTDASKLPAYVRPPECVDPEVVKKICGSGKVSV